MKIEIELADYDAITQALAEARAEIKELKDEIRCPSCNCATQEDAEASECGCEEPICARDGEKTLAQCYLELRAEVERLRAELAEANKETMAAAQETRRMFQAIWSIAEQVKNSPTLRAEIEPVKASFTLECPHCKQQTHPEGCCHGFMLCEHCDENYLFNAYTGEVKVP